MTEDVQNGNNTNEDIDYILGINCLRKKDLDELKKLANTKGIIVSFRQINPKATTRLDEEGYPKRIDNHAKSSEQDALITCNAQLSKLSREYKKALDDGNKRKIMERINKANIDNGEIIKEGKENNETEKEKLNEIINKIKETRETEYQNFYIEYLRDRLEYINGLRIQIPAVDILLDNDKNKFDIVYLKRENKDDQYPIEIDNNGDPLLYAEKDGFLLYEIKLDEKGKKTLGNSVTQPFNLKEYKIEKREIFTTVEYKVDTIMEQINNGNYDIDINSKEYRNERKNTADYDQLFAANNYKSSKFIIEELNRADGCFKDEQDEQFNNIINTDLNTIITDDKKLKEYLYNYNYFQITDPPNKRIEEKINKSTVYLNNLNEIKNYITEFLKDNLNNLDQISTSFEKLQTNDNLNDDRKLIEKYKNLLKNNSEEGKNEVLEDIKYYFNGHLEVKLERKIIQTLTKINKLKSLGTPHITTETLISATKGTINHGPETYHYYPEGFKTNDGNLGEIIVTIIPPEEILNQIEDDESLENVRKKGDLIVLEGIEGVVSFVNFCQKEGLASIEINPFWPLDVNFSKSPTELMTTTVPIISEEDYKILINEDKDLINKLIYAERLRLQPDNLTIPLEIKNNLEGQGTKIEEIRQFIKNKNLEKVVETYKIIEDKIENKLSVNGIKKNLKNILIKLQNQIKDRVKNILIYNTNIDKIKQNSLEKSMSKTNTKILELKINEQCGNKIKIKNGELKIFRANSALAIEKFDNALLQSEQKRRFSNIF